MSSEQHNEQLTKLIENLTECFDGEELRALCFGMGVDYDDLTGEVKSGKAREFVAYLERRGRVPELVKVCRKLRSNAEWQYHGLGPEAQGYLRGAVLYANVMGFSTLGDIEQDQAVDLLKREVDQFLAIFERDCWLDFRGGDFLLFLEHKPAVRSGDTLVKAFFFGLRLQTQMQMAQPALRVGITLHWEDNARPCHLGDKAHLIGQALDEVRLLMSFSDSGHFFISTNAYGTLRKLIGQPADFDRLLTAMQDRLEDEPPGCKQLLLPPQRSGYKCETFTFHDEHKREHVLWNLYTEPLSNQIGIGDLVIPCHRVAIEYRDKRDIEGGQHVFIQRLVEADEVSIIALTHENTTKYLLEAIEQRENAGRGFWSQLRLVFPSQAVLEEVIDQHPTTAARLDRWNYGKRNVFQFLLTRGPEYIGRWECLEFDGNLPFWGNWFIGKKNSSVRVAPILPGCDQKDTYYTEFFKGMPAYVQLEKAFSVICSRSSRIVEWDLYGQWKEGAFYYDGVVNRIRWNELGKTGAVCFPVVLIMLYSNMGTGFRSILQQRTIHNASSDTGKFSNISGRVTDMDVSTAKGLPPCIDFQVQSDAIATIELNKRAGLNRGDLLPPGTWAAAAVREIQEELGLTISPDRLKHHSWCYLERDNGNLLFPIFSLELRLDAHIDELQAIRDSRPYASLSDFNLRQLQRYHDEHKFNHLLQNRFDQVFVPIFEKLGIEK